MCPGRRKCSGFADGSQRALRVMARSDAEMPVDVFNFASCRAKGRWRGHSPISQIRNDLTSSDSRFTCSFAGVNGVTSCEVRDLAVQVSIL
jgi:hypothetical protein